MKFDGSSRGYRLVVGFILPPFFGTALFLAIAMVEQLSAEHLQYDDIASMFIYFPFVLMAAMFFVGIQSLLYSLTMEFIIRPILFRRNRFLIAGSFLGFIAALFPAIWFASPVIFLPIGIVVGVVVGLLIYHKDH